MINGMQYRIKYSLAGLGIGFLIASAVYLFDLLFDVFGLTDDLIFMIVYLFCVLCEIFLSTYIGYKVGAFLYCNFLDDVKELEAEYKNIENKALSSRFPESSYDDVLEMKKYNKQDNYQEYFSNALYNHRTRLVNSICKGVMTDKTNAVIALNKLCFLKESYKDSVQYDWYDIAIEILDNFCKEASKTEPLYLHINNYGSFELPLDNPDEIEYMDNTALKTLEKLTGDSAFFGDNQDGKFNGIVNYMDECFLCNTAKVMWYFAKKKPFIVSEFEQARNLYSKYTSESFIPSKYENLNAEERNKHIHHIGKVEEILAVIYSKNQIGGKGAVQQEKEYIDAWLEKKIKEKNNKECELLASGLAWMELHKLELEVLHKMVQGNIQLSAELQDRLRFLESCGISNIKIYEVDATNDFVCDSSSVHWNNSEYDVFFRKIAMKKLELNYSLAISDWKKTLPLTSGQEFSSEELYNQFKKMVLDFDGEVSCSKVKARAIDLANVEYPNAVLFRFNSERNRCLSMLFSSDKFGKNLNLMIITLFTPESGMDVASMQKYATAIKSNIYVDSFRETILQSVDEIIKVENNIYDDEDNLFSNEYFE